jgi:hypothetical protein
MFTRIKIIIQIFIRLIQKTIVTISLFLIYIFGFGVTVIFIMLFSRDILIIRSDKKDTFWAQAEDYETDIEGSLRQS